MPARRHSPKDSVPAPTEHHSRASMLSNFILGSQDGLVNVLGIVLGVSVATSDVRILFIAGLAALAAESISMGAVAYTSTLARRKYYAKQLGVEKEEIRRMPKVEREEVKTILGEWGYRGRALADITDRIIANPKAWLEFMMSYELNLERIHSSEPLRNAFVVGASTVFGSAIPLIPFIFLSGSFATAAYAAIIVSGVVLFLIGYYEAKLTVGSLVWTGVKLAAIGLVAGLAGYVIGRLIGAPV